MNISKNYKKYDMYEETDFLKDCPTGEFVQTILPPVKRIIAIGDIHGDLNLAIKSFKMAKLINDNMEWIAIPKDTVVVQVGDQIDSCRPIPGVFDCQNKKQPGDKGEDMKVLDFFNTMHGKAKIHGGAVYSLLGNHELMNSLGDFKYVSYDNFYNYQYKINNQNFSGPNGRVEAFKPGGQVSSMIACTRQSVLIIGSTMFVHAGMLPALSAKMEYLNTDIKSKLKYLNATVRKWLLNRLIKDDKFVKSIIIRDSKISPSPFWTRIYGSIPINTSLESGQCYKSVKKALEVYQIGQLVVGHTPQLFTNKDGINGTCYETDGTSKLYRVDGGFSHGF